MAKMAKIAKNGDFGKIAIFHFWGRDFLGSFLKNAKNGDFAKIVIFGLKNDDFLANRFP